MAKRQEDPDQGVERMLALSATANDVAFTVTRGVTRPVWEPDERSFSPVRLRKYPRVAKSPNGSNVTAWIR
jgi:hypothetical protein